MENDKYGISRPRPVFYIHSQAQTVLDSAKLGSLLKSTAQVGTFLEKAAFLPAPLPGSFPNRVSCLDGKDGIQDPQYKYRIFPDLTYIPNPIAEFYFLPWRLSGEFLQSPIPVRSCAISGHIAPSKRRA